MNPILFDEFKKMMQESSQKFECELEHEIILPQATQLVKFEYCGNSNFNKEALHVVKVI